jgi:hypothetical protein
MVAVGGQWSLRIAGGREWWFSSYVTIPEGFSWNFRPKNECLLLNIVEQASVSYRRYKVYLYDFVSQHSKNQCSLLFTRRLINTGPTNCWTVGNGTGYKWSWFVGVCKSTWKGRSIRSPVFVMFHIQRYLSWLLRTRQFASRNAFGKPYLHTRCLVNCITAIQLVSTCETKLSL